MLQLLQFVVAFVVAVYVCSPLPTGMVQTNSESSQPAILFQLSQPVCMAVMDMFMLHIEHDVHVLLCFHTPLGISA